MFEFDYELVDGEEPAEPVDLLLGLIEAVVDLNLQHGIENSLDAKLSAALDALEASTKTGSPPPSTRWKPSSARSKPKAANTSTPRTPTNS